LFKFTTTILTTDILVHQPKLLEDFDTQKVSWNPHKHCLAFVSGKDQVTVHDFEDPGEIYLLLISMDIVPDF
jgi:hypothetical protein